VGLLRRSWDGRVEHAEEVARGPGLQALRDRIVALACPVPGEVVVDLGSGTGLLALAFAGAAQKVWAVDSSRAMGEHLRVKADSAEFESVRIVHASATCLPLVDGAADLVVSNYCFHEMSESDKRRALAEAFRVLRPGGRLVIGDMMFSISLRSSRDRRLVGEMVLAIGRRGLPGMLRVLKNGLRVAVGRWERPQTAEWWREALETGGFEDVSVEVLRHEGGIASAHRPALESVNGAKPLPGGEHATGGPWRRVLPDHPAVSRTARGHR